MSDDIITTGANTQLPDGAGQQPEQRTFTQSELDALIGQRLKEQTERERRRLQEQYGDLEELAAAKQKLSDLQQAELSETERLRQQLQALELKASQAEEGRKQEALRALRLEVGQEVGLPVSLATRLAGEDRDGIKADAEQVLAALREMGAQRQPPNIDATAGSSNDKPAHGLTAAERALADKFGIPYEQYAKNKLALEGKR